MNLSHPIARFANLCLLLLLLAAIVRAQPSAPLNAAETALALKRLAVVGSALYVGAHPDDENTALLAYLARGRGLRTAYLSVTRGDGGQNLIGAEKGELLGLIRTEELLAARQIDGAEQFFTRAVDFGFTKSTEEALRVWGHDAVLADVVWVIRRFRPDIIITRFPATGEGGHGQHTASAILAREAFEAAGDPARFPEQLRDVQPWKPKRLMWNVFSRQGERPSNHPNLVSVDVGAYNPLLGKSYTEIAAASRSMHKSQGFGSAERRGTALNHFAHLAGESATRDIFDGVDLSWSRVPGGALVSQLLEQAAREYRPQNPQTILPLLVRAHREMNRLAARQDTTLIGPKLWELRELIRACAGLWIENIAAEPDATPGGEVRVTTTLISRSEYPLRLKRVLMDYRNIDLREDRRQTVDAELKNNQPVQIETVVRIPVDAEPSQPYWLRRPPKTGLFHVDGQGLVGEPRNGTLLPVTLVVAAGPEGDEIYFQTEVSYRWTDRVRGELYRRVVIVPEVAVSLAEKVVVFPDPAPKQVSVTLKSNVAGAVSGTLRLRLPDGWTATPAAVPVALGSKDEEFKAAFNVTPPVAASTATLGAELETGRGRFTRGLVEIDYEHIPRQIIFPPAETKLVRVDLRKRGQRIGYVMGAGDEMPEALRQVGYEVVLLSDEDLDVADLSQFDAVVTGVRAYNTRPRLRQRQVRLLEYVARGGTLVVQYNTPDRALEGFTLGPFPLRLSRDARVTVEDAPVTLLAPQDALLHAPNKITTADFDGWVQERGLNYPAEWDARYLPLVESHDPGEKELRGGTLVARYGRGVYIYTSLAFFRQLPAGVPGAYRLFVNLISAGK